MSLLLLGGTKVVAGGGGVDPFFEETFAGGQFNPANGFTWNTPSSAVSIVSFDGYDCMRLRYIAKPSGEDGMAEQRFNMGRYLNEVWIEYYIHIPTNYEHRATEPDNIENNKWFAVWRDVYSDVVGGTQQFTMETWNLTNTTGPDSTWRLAARRVELNSMTDIVSDPQNQAPFIGGGGPLTTGSWHQIRYRIRGSSAYGVNDGLFTMWVNGAVFQDLVSRPFYNAFESPSDVAYRNGYFMGYSNSGFTEETHFHIRAPKFYSTNPGW